MKRFLRKLSVTLKRGWRNVGGLDFATTLGAIIVMCTILTTYLGVIIRDPFIPMAIKLYWGAFVGSILLIFFYGVTHYAL